MKKGLIFIIIVVLNFNAYAQKEETEKRFFSKDKLFTGGSINLGFSSGVTAIGANPVFGISLNKIVDVGIGFNYNYTAYRFSNGDKERFTVLGPGIFTRIFPVNFLFVQAQYERNFIKDKYISNFGQPDYIIKYQANSLLVGGGYCLGREDENSPFYYVAILVDVSGDKRSPYVDEYARIIPMIRAGVQVPLFRGK